MSVERGEKTSNLRDEKLDKQRGRHTDTQKTHIQKKKSKVTKHDSNNHKKVLEDKKRVRIMV